MASGQYDNENRQTACIACLEPIRNGAGTCPHCGSSQYSQRWHNFSQALKWVGGIVTTISLVVGVITLSRFYLDWKERSDALSEIVAAADWLIDSKNYLQAWDMYARAADLNPSSSKVREGRVNLSLLWIRDFSIEKEKVDETLTSLTATLYRGLHGADANQRARILAHIGYIQLLRHIEQLPVFTDVESLFDRAREASPENVYANAMYARWLLQETPTTVEQLDEAQQFYDRALVTATEKERAYVRRLQFDSFKLGADPDIARNAFVKLIGISIDMHKNAEGYPAWANLWKIFGGYLINANLVDFVVTELPAKPHLEAFEWLLESDEADKLLRENEYVNSQSIYVRARLNEKIGDSQTALELYQAMLDLVAIYGIDEQVNLGIERLTGQLPERALARNYYDDPVDESDEYQFHKLTLINYDPARRGPNYDQALAYFEALIEHDWGQLKKWEYIFRIFIGNARQAVRDADYMENADGNTSFNSSYANDRARQSWIDMVRLYAHWLKADNNYEKALAELGDVSKSINLLDQEDWHRQQALLDYEMAVLHALLASDNNNADDKEQSVQLLLSAVEKGVVATSVSWRDITDEQFAAIADDKRYKKLIRGRGHKRPRPREIGTFVPLYGAPRGLRAAPVAHAQWQGALSAQNALPRRHDTCDLRAPGFHRQACRPGAETAGQPHSLPWRFRPQQPPSRPGDARQARQGQFAPHTR